MSKVANPKNRAARFPRSAETQDRILRAARRLFAKHGYENTTIRAVASAADIHPSMVMRYFDSKEGLFAAAAELDLQIPDLGAAKRDEIGARLVRHFLDQWEAGASELPVVLRASATNSLAQARVIKIFKEQVAPAIARLVPSERQEECAALISSQLLGLAFTRYVLRLPPVVSLPRDVLERRIGAALQGYLDQ
jgi:AcrR family transcriptional regulator